jgi:hypothetical protein
MFEAEEAVTQAQADYAYRKVKSEGLADSAEDIRKAILGEGMSGEKNQIRVVSSADEAQLIVEVNGRRSSSSGATGGLMALRDDQFYISFLLKAGPKLQAERFANVPRTYRLRGFGATVYRLGVPKPDAPWWRFEAYGTMKWGSAANGASKLVEDFIRKNYDAMMAPAANQRALTEFDPRSPLHQPVTTQSIPAAAVRSSIVNVCRDFDARHTQTTLNYRQSLNSSRVRHMLANPCSYLS